MPLIIQVAIISTAAALLVLLLRSALVRVFSSEKTTQAEKIVPFLVGTIGGYYGLLTGFILSSAWADVQSVRNAATIEVNALADLGRIAVNLPPPVSVELAHGVEGYLQSVVQEDLKAMARGRVSPETTTALNRLWLILGRFQPESPWEATLIGRALDKVGVVGDQRRIRIFASGDSIPWILWVILLGGGVIIVYGVTIVSLRYERPAVEILAAVAVMLATVLFGIYALDQPFRYGLSPGSERYIALWEAFRTAEGVSPETGGAGQPAEATR